jgi:hypothetical protein
MKVIAPKSFNHMKIGFIEKNVEFDIDDKEGARLISLDLLKEVKQKKAETYDTKIVAEKPAEVKTTKSSKK